MRFCQFLKMSESEPISSKHLFQIPVVSALWRFISGEKLPYDHLKAHKFLLAMDNLIEQKSSGIGYLSALVPFLGKLFLDLGISCEKAAYEDQVSFVQDAINDSKAKFEEEDLQTFCQYYILEMQEASQNPSYSSFKDRDGKINFVSVLIDLFQGGSETLSSTLTWAMLCLLKNNEVQKKIQCELDSVFGKLQPVDVSKRSETPYTEAFLHELQRKANVLHFAIPHCAEEDALLGRHFIPQGTLIFPNLGGIFQNEQNFPNPEKFDPERFLNEQGEFQSHKKGDPIWRWSP